jgi:hypothetical protein
MAALNEYDHRDRAWPEMENPTMTPVIPSWVSNSGIIANGVGLAGLLTTQNLMFCAGIAVGVSTVVMQIWFEWAKRRAFNNMESQARQHQLDMEQSLHLARLRLQAEREGINPDSVLDLKVIN